MKHIIFVVILLSFFAGVVYVWMNREEPRNKIETQENARVQLQEEIREKIRKKTREEKQEEAPTKITEEFILRWLQNENGTIATYIQNSGVVDEDLVSGREALAETLGILMYYALDINDQTIFNKVYKQLTDYFLQDDGFVNWKLNEDGTSDVSANALIDDIRIVYALALAAEKWDTDEYQSTAISISNYLNEHNVRNGIYTNFYDQEYAYASSDISLSYIDIQGMEYLIIRGLLNAEVVTNTSRILTEAPLDNGFYPMSYNVEENQYTFSDNINIVDQAILAYHYAQVGNQSEEFLDFIKSEMDSRGLIHGMYDRQTKEPTVNYESPAIYGFLILYALEADENDLAQLIYERLKEFQVVDEDNEYYGGYSITDGDTHVFDNLVPLLAEQELRNN